MFKIILLAIVQYLQTFRLSDATNETITVNNSPALADVLLIFQEYYNHTLDEQ